MVPRPFLLLILAAALAISGCSVFPGLRVITGQQDAIEPQRTVESIDLVMADKTGGTDPSVLLIGDRIEAALQSVDVIEVRETNPGTFDVEMIFNTSGIQSQRDLFEALRRASEVTWRAVLAQNINELQTIQVTFLAPMAIDTLDNGPSFLGQRLLSLDIDRADAAAYLSIPQTSLQTFQDLIVDGKLRIDEPTSAEFYQGDPNHPMFMMPSNAPDVLG